MRVMDDGTPRALQPLAEEVLAWVAALPKKFKEMGVDAVISGMGC